MELKVVLHGFAGSRLKADLENLRRLRTKWRRTFRSAEIYLITRNGLFHSKVVVFSRSGRATALVGSANATTAAYQENEEIMLAMDGNTLPESIKTYLSRLDSAARSLDDVQEPEVRSLIAFFRSGDVYYRPNAMPLFRFDFRLPEGLRQSLSRMTVDIPGFTAKASKTYNPFAGLGKDLRDEEARLNLDEETSANAAAHRIPIRPYAVQTAYGWWAPCAYHPIIDAAISGASSKRARRLKLLRTHFVNAVATGTIVAQAEKSFRKLADFARAQGSILSESPAARLRRFEEFLMTCKTRLNNPRWFERASRVYTRATMPEIWSDPVARLDFVESFFDYLQYVNTAPTTPLIMKSLQRTGIKRAAGAEEIQSTLEESLQRRGWPDGAWIIPGRLG